MKKEKYIGLIYIMPWLIGFLVFTLYPLASSLYYSFTDFSIANEPKWVGLDNYIEIFTSDRLAIPSLVTTFKYVFMVVPAKLAAALFVAVLMNQNIKGMRFYRTIYCLHNQMKIHHDGIVNMILAVVGIAPVDWLGSPKHALGTVALLGIWQFGSSMVLFLAGLKQVPAELYDAAKVDGAGKIRTFFSVTLPMISSIIFFNLVMQLINAFQDFTAPFVITGGGPLNATYVFAIHLYNSAFKYFKTGYASALSWILFVIIMLFTMLVFKSSAYWTYYEDGGDF